jgi:hypothetical protein
MDMDTDPPTTEAGSGHVKPENSTGVADAAAGHDTVNTAAHTDSEPARTGPVSPGSSLPSVPGQGKADAVPADTLLAGPDNVQFEKIWFELGRHTGSLFLLKGPSEQEPWGLRIPLTRLLPEGADQGSGVVANLLSQLQVRSCRVSRHANLTIEHECLQLAMLDTLLQLPAVYHCSLYRAAARYS